MLVLMIGNKAQEFQNSDLVNYRYVQSCGLETRESEVFVLSAFGVRAEMARLEYENEQHSKNGFQNRIEIEVVSAVNMHPLRRGVKKPKY